MNKKGKMTVSYEHHLKKAHDALCKLEHECFFYIERKHKALVKGTKKILPDLTQASEEAKWAKEQYDDFESEAPKRSPALTLSQEEWEEGWEEIKNNYSQATLRLSKHSPSLFHDLIVEYCISCYTQNCIRELANAAHKLERSFQGKQEDNILRVGSELLDRFWRIGLKPNAPIALVRGYPNHESVSKQDLKTRLDKGYPRVFFTYWKGARAKHSAMDDDCIVTYLEKQEALRKILGTDPVPTDRNPEIHELSRALFHNEKSMHIIHSNKIFWEETKETWRKVEEIVLPLVVFGVALGRASSAFFERWLEEAGLESV